VIGAGRRGKCDVGHADRYLDEDADRYLDEDIGDYRRAGDSENPPCPPPGHGERAGKRRRLVEGYEGEEQVKAARPIGDHRHEDRDGERQAATPPYVSA
jgi:hypothetical protein